MKRGLAIWIADKLPPPGKGKSDYGKSDYGNSDDSGGDTGDSSDAGDDEDMELSTMADYRKCLETRDDKGALGHLRDLIAMLSSPEEQSE